MSKVSGKNPRRGRRPIGHDLIADSETNDAKRWLEASWLVFLARLQAKRGSADAGLLTFPETLFLSKSVAYFAVARCGNDQQRLERYLGHLNGVLAGRQLAELAAMRPAHSGPDYIKALARLAVDRLTEELWCRAALEILADYRELRDADVGSALIDLRNALDLAGMDGATSCMIDGVEALIDGDLKLAAAIGVRGWVRDGEAQDLINWMRARCGPSAALYQAAGVMDLAAWALHEVAQSWPGERRDLQKLHLSVGRAADWLLFRRSCREVLVRLRLV